MSSISVKMRLLAGAATLCCAPIGVACATPTDAKSGPNAAVTPDTTAPADQATQAGKADPQAAAGQERASGIAEGSDIIVTATRANEIAPVTASLKEAQPASIISRSFIEDSLPASADFNQIALISPSVSNTGAANGVGLSESKAQIRGFQDGEYNVTYDGVPFGDTNDPSHHSNTFFPSNTIETEIVDRGPGNASQLGQATFGGNINLFSRETRARPGLEVKGSYGTYNTYLGRVVAQTGAIDKLGGTEIVFSAQHIGSNGARTFSKFSSNNVFGKIVIPVGPKARLTILGTYNENSFNQPDNDGVTLGQAALYGKYFSLTNDPNTMNYFRYNYTHKTTDFEIVKFEAELAPNSTFENRAYTYSYDNETLTGNDPTIYGTAFPIVTAGVVTGTSTPAQVGAAVTAANIVIPTPGAKAVFGVPGYTKTNKYRVFGDIIKTRLDFGFGALTAGAWLEFSNTYRQQRDVNLIDMSPNYIERAVTNPTTLAVTPQNIKFDQKSRTNHTEEFVELELRPIAGLTITPGYKHVDFERKIDATYNQTTRYAQRQENTYTADLPFAQINYAITPKLSVYGEFAKGFLAPPLSVLYVAKPGLSTVAPERSTNYQAGVVFHGQNLSIDFDGYKIDFTNKFASVVLTTSTGGTPDGTVFLNQGAVTYKGLEGQVTYALPQGVAVFANGSRNYAKTNNAGQPQQQVAKAPEYTAAGGVLYKQGPIRFSLIDKWVGRQYFVNPPGTVAPTSFDSYNNSTYQSKGYNSAILSVRYDIGRVRFGLEVYNLLDSTRVTSISQGKAATGTSGLNSVFPYDQYIFQTGRQFTGDITIVL